MGTSTRENMDAPAGLERATKLLMPRRALSAAVLALLALAVGTACDSPTLPLPPPQTPSVAQSAPNRYHLHSDKGAEPNAVIVIYNHDPNVSLSDRVDGAQADQDGTWDETITAFPGDTIDVSQQFGSTESPQTTFTIPK